MTRAGQVAPVGSQYRSAAESLIFSISTLDRSTSADIPDPHQESVSHRPVSSFGLPRVRGLHHRYEWREAA